MKNILTRSTFLAMWLLVSNCFANSEYIYSLDRNLVNGTSLNAQSLAIQTDGKILIGDAFALFDDQNRPTITFLTRWNIDGTRDQNFNADVNGAILSIIYLANGKILIGGAFTEVNGARRHNLARLNADGSLDPSWSANTDFRVQKVVAQPDGNFVLVGDFQNIGGDFTPGSGTDRNRIARIDQNGMVDQGFNPNANDVVSSIILQANGQFIIAGQFSSVGGVSKNKVARLNSDGTVDNQFDFEAGFDSYRVAVDSNGSVFVGGQSVDESLNSITHLFKLNLDGSFGVALGIVEGKVFKLVVLSDHSILVGGRFEKIGNRGIRNLARIDADGVIDSKFDFGRNEDVITIEVQGDGKVFIGDRGRIMRLENRLVDESFCVPIKGKSDKAVLICL